MNVNAQSDDPLNEIGVSYGLGVSLIGDGIGNGIGFALFESWSGRKLTNDKQFGSLGVEYFRHLDNPRMAVGAIATYAQYGEDVEYVGAIGTYTPYGEYVEYKNQKVGERTRHYFSLMPAFKYYYVNGKHFGMYSKLAAGAMMSVFKSEDTKGGSDSDSKIYFMYQVSALGIEFGSQNFRGFLEAGAGEQGIVLAGLKYKF
ncbi:MAG: hypothetical protein VZQ78_07965, partial [Prevotella sp.]|nr:hypothetical protein [Prevotella sp.]